MLSTTMDIAHLSPAAVLDHDEQFSCPPRYEMTMHDLNALWEIIRNQMRQKRESLPLSSYARTMLEDDEKFYEAFPQARTAAIEKWLSEQLPYDMVNYGPHARPAHQQHMPTSSYATVPRHAAHADHLAAASFPVDLHYDYVLQDHLNELSSSTYVADQSDDVIHALIPSIPPTPAILEVKSQYVVPSQRPRSNGSRTLISARPLHSHSMNDVIGYHPHLNNTNDIDTTPPCSPCSPSFGQSFPPQPTIAFAQPIVFTGNWEHDVLATDERLLHASPPYPLISKLPSLSSLDKPVVDVPPTRRHHLTYRQKRTERSRSQPYLTVHLPTPVREGSANPMTRRRIKQPTRADGKPILACHFCRGRKIACGPPSVEGDQKTCNQCERRGLLCSYPLESRRGMRKKKEEKEVKAEDDVDADMHEDADVDTDADDADADGEDDDDDCGGSP